MRQVVAAAAALNQTPLDWERNTRNIRRAISDARRAGAKVLCLPELCIPGYGCEDAFHAPWVIERAANIALELAQHTKGMAVSVGLPLEVDGAVYNTVALIVDGRIRGFVAKQHLAGDGIHYEPRWFKPWPTGIVSSVSVGGRSYPIGDLVFDLDGVRLGFEICEDAWVARRSGADLAELGADLILNPSASHFAFGKHEIRKRFVVEGSRAFGVSYVYANLLGCESGRIIYDGDTMIASHGEIAALGPRFSYRDVVVTSGRVDIERSRLARFRQASFRPCHTSPHRVIAVDFSVTGGAAPAGAAAPEWERGPSVKHEEFWRAVSLGLFDYLRKSVSHGFVVSLSGGVDSSAASCLVKFSIVAAVREIGIAEVKSKLEHVTGIAKARTEKELTAALLACVYQRTVNSSEVTRNAAKSVAGELGATFIDLDVSDLVTKYEVMVSDAVGETMSWKEHDIARQNIQARVRSPGVWLIANLRKALLLSTSNRSEAAVGYTTMDGDSSGGLSPLGGIDKAYLREWLRWAESSGPAEIGPIASLHLVNAQQPTAELRPLKDHQTDERDLMPYVVLDRIERYAIRDKLSPRDVLTRLDEDFDDRYDHIELTGWVKRFFRLWSANQWKRERYAPSFHLDDESLDPKTWCRFPILSGGFSEELKDLDTKKIVRPKRRTARPRLRSR